MTILNFKDTDRVLTDDFSLEFLQAKLIQKTKENPVVYTGPASVVQSEDGVLKLKLYHLFQSSSEVTREISATFNNGFQPGQIIGDQHYFDFEGIDLHGAKWTSPKIWLSGDVSCPANGKIVTADLLLIESERQAGSGTSQGVAKAQLFIPGSYRIPYFKTETQGALTTRSICELNVGGRTCTLRKQDRHLEVSADLAGIESANDYLDLILEGIGIGIGSELRPKLIKILHSGVHRQTIYSRNVSAVHPTLTAPFPTSQPDNAKSLETFLDRFLGVIPNRHSALFGYWHRVLTAFSSGVENSALVLTTAIEGVLKAYFTDCGMPDAEFIKQLEEAKPAVESLSIGDRAKSRLLTTLGNAKVPTPKNSLFSLRSRGLITDELIRLWTRLRNKSAHADELNLQDHELQAYLNELHGCLELFYRLVLVYVGYSGTMLEYSKSGWPEATFEAGTYCSGTVKSLLDCSPP